MRLERTCGLAACFLAAVSTGGIVCRALPQQMGDVRAGQGLLCYANQCPWATCSCGCPIIATPEDFCATCIPAAGTQTVPCPGCVSCANCSCGGFISCGNVVWNCVGGNCSGGPAPDWTKCTKTDKKDFCTKTFGCANGTGSPCPNGSC
jgi:hypothetical protein